MLVKESVARDLLRLIVWYPIRWLMLALPATWGISLTRTLGDIHYLFSREGKKNLDLNISRFQSPPVEKPFDYSVREYFRNHYIDRLLIFIFPKFSKEGVKKIVDITGLENLDKALEKGKGVILVHGHFGPVHLPLVTLARLGYRMKQIGLPSDEGLSWIGRNVAFRLRLYYESLIPAEIIKADSFLRGVFKWLNSNGIIMITGDGSGTERQVGKYKIFNFLGQPVMFPLGPAILSQKTDAAIIPMFITPGRNGFLYRIVIEQPLISNKLVDDTRLDITEQFVKRLAYYISQYPGYMHFLDRFAPGQLICQKNDSEIFS